MYLQNILGENLGSGHFYLAKNRTFLLCVDIQPLADPFALQFALVHLARTTAP